MGKEGRWSPPFRERAPMLALVGCLLAASPREAALVPVAVHPAPGYGETVEAKPPTKTTDPDAVDPHARLVPTRRGTRVLQGQHYRQRPNDVLLKEVRAMRGLALRKRTRRCEGVLPRGHHARKRRQLLRDRGPDQLRHALDVREGPVLTYVPAAPRMLYHLGQARAGLHRGGKLKVRQ